MKIKIWLLVFGLIFAFSQTGSAQMGSTNYFIKTSVISSSGEPMSSASFQTNSTLGQSSPIIPADSASFQTYPGFWYTLVKPFCPWDLEPDFLPDGDIDGLDLDAFIEDFDPGVSGKYDEIHLEEFANEFGKTDRSD